MDTESMDIEQNQYLTFKLSGEEFGIGILKVREIIEYTSPTQVPMVPEYIKGVINLRGNVVPVIDLKAKFNMPGSEATKRSCVVIVEVTMDGEEITMGILIDAVSEVLEISPRDISPAPSFGAKINVDFIQGMARVDREFIILLDIERILSTEEIAVMNQVIGSTQEKGSDTIEDMDMAASSDKR